MRKARNPKSVFSQRLIGLRTARGLTQEAFAKALGVSRDVIAYYETRANNPTAEFIQRVADFFGVPVDQLLKSAAQKRTRPGPTSKLEHQLEMIRKLPKEQQKAVSTVLDMALQNAGPE